MRKTVAYLALIVLLGCGKENAQTDRELLGQTNAIHILFDLTEKSSQNSTLPLKELIDNLAKNSDGEDRAGLKAYIHTISDISDTKTQRIQYEILPATAFDTRLKRLEEKRKFKQELANVIGQVVDTNVSLGKNKSKIYAKLCEELNNNNDSGRRIFVIFSDMLENDKISFYGMTIKSKFLKKTINEADTELGKLYNCQLPDLSKTEVYVITDRNEKNDELINTAKTFWTALFKKHNCKKIAFDAQLLL